MNILLFALVIGGCVGILILALVMVRKLEPVKRQALTRLSVATLLILLSFIVLVVYFLR